MTAAHSDQESRTAPRRRRSTTVRFKAYEPKPLDPGQRIDSDVVHGVVWSGGPAPSSLWVLDDSGEAVAVKVSRGEITHRLEVVDWRRTVRRIERVRGGRGLVASRDELRYGERVVGQVLTAHLDTQCPALLAGERVADYDLGVQQAVDLLLGHGVGVGLPRNICPCLDGAAVEADQ